ncbi:MAG: hypothetical protein RL291_537 [Pseudomonadota bacterium]
MARLTKASKQKTTLTVRAEFQRVRGGFRFSSPLFALEGKQRDPDAAPRAGEGARFGLTVSKKVGNAVERNRVKRRLRAAVAAVRGDAPVATDFVIIARDKLLTAPFEDILKDLKRGLSRAQTMRNPANRGKPD